MLDADEYKEMLETENEYAAKAELQTIVVDFYVRNGVVSSDKEPCEGYSLNPYISNIEVEEGKLSVEPVQIGEHLPHQLHTLNYPVFFFHVVFISAVRADLLSDGIKASAAACALYRGDGKAGNFFLGDVAA